MKKIFKNYKQTIILLGAIIIGGIIGFIFKEDAVVLKPFGDLFINMMFIIIVPLIFLTIASSIIKMEDTKRLGKVMSRIFIVFIITSVVAVVIGLIGTSFTQLVSSGDVKEITRLFDYSARIDTELNLLDRTVSLISVNDFSGLFSKDNIIAILVFALMFGTAIRMGKTKTKKVKELVLELNEIMLNLIKIVMYYAPIGLGAYFAALIATYGGEIALGFIKTFLIYTVVSILVYIFLYSLYAYLGGGKKGLKSYWKNVIPPTVTALATCSSAASIPVNIEAVKKIGVSDDIAESIVPLGTSFHKEGSVIGSVFKIMFLVHLFQADASIFKIALVAIVATLLVSAVPVGGGTISEMMILSMMGFPAAALPILTIIATIIDAPATVLNVVGDTSTSMLVARSTDGIDWNK